MLMDQHGDKIPHEGSPSPADDGRRRHLMDGWMGQWMDGHAMNGAHFVDLTRAASGNAALVINHYDNLISHLTGYVS